MKEVFRELNSSPIGKLFMIGFLIVILLIGLEIFKMIPAKEKNENEKESEKPILIDEDKEYMVMWL